MIKIINSNYKPISNIHQKRTFVKYLLNSASWLSLHSNLKQFNIQLNINLLILLKNGIINYFRNASREKKLQAHTTHNVYSFV